MRLFIIFLNILIMAGCVFVGNSASESNEIVIDDSILGIWQGVDKRHFFHVGKMVNAPDNKTLEIISIEHKSDGSLEQNKYIGRVEKFGDNLFLVIKIETSNKSEFKFVYLPYVMKKDSQIEMCVLNFSFLLDEVSNQKLKGKKMNSDVGEYLILNGQDKNLLEYFEKKKLRDYSTECVILNSIQ